MFTKITKNGLKSLIIMSSLLSVAQAHGPTTAAEWDYSAAEGPAKWSELAPDYSLCATGKTAVTY